MKQFGLIGYRLDYSFSKTFFEQKFRDENLTDHEYLNFELKDIHEFPELLKNTPNLIGLNCTIPYKEQVIEFLDEIDPEAERVGAVNTIKITRQNGKIILRGFNTDVFGFEHSLRPWLLKKDIKALILGTGGASKAVQFVLHKLKIDYLLVSTKLQLGDDEISYLSLDHSILSDRHLIINTTPLGTFPEVNQRPDIPFRFIGSNHFLFDLVYNPAMTLFMKEGSQRGAKVKNGLEMLQLQAQRSWEIWNSK